MNIILDTNILIQNSGRVKESFEALSRLAIAGKLKIYVSEITEREFLIKRVGYAAEKAYALKTSSDNILKGYRNTDKVDDIERFKQFIDFIVEDYINLERRSYLSWKIRNDVRVIPLSFSSSQDVFDAYFNGSSPFDKERSKAHFPDAFIISSIENFFIASTSINCIVTQDKRFASSISSKFQVFDSLDTLLKYDEMINLIESIMVDKELETAEMILSQLTWNLSTIERSCEESIVAFAKDEYAYEFEDGYSCDFSGITLYLDNIESTYYGDGYFSMPIAGHAELLTYVFLESANKDSIREHFESGYQISDQNDEYTYAQRFDNHSFSGRVILSFPLEDVRNGKILRDGLFHSLHRSDISVEDLKFSDSPIH